MCAALNGSEAITAFAAAVFAPDIWRGKSRTETEAEANRLAEEIRSVFRSSNNAAFRAIADQARLTIFKLRAEKARARPPIKLGKATPTVAL
jgi:hypothetical protein